jgi:hypothetical protein
MEEPKEENMSNICRDKKGYYDISPIMRNLLLYDVWPLQFIFSLCAGPLGFGELARVLAYIKIFASLLCKLSCYENSQLNICII